jgi:hypothetical protein
MRSPFQSEGEAFQFLLATVCAFAAVAVASLLGGAWAGVPVWAVATVAAALVYFRRGRRQRQLRTAPAHIGGDNDRRVLVLTTATITNQGLADKVARATSGYQAQVLVVSPATPTRLRHLTSDVNGASAQAQKRLEQSLNQLSTAGIHAQGKIGDENPLQAIEDALRSFGADEIIIATPPQHDNRIDPGIVQATRERFALPVSHLPTGD